MDNSANASSAMAQVFPPVPPDDLSRNLTVARPNEDQASPHIGLSGDIYTILLSGEDTAGRYCLIDMLVPPGGGPSPHRHDFEESFTVLAGEIAVTFRGATAVLHAGEAANIPANAPHQFRNTTEQPARLLCICAPAGQEELFRAVGVPVASRTAAPPGSTPPPRRSSKRKPRHSSHATGRSYSRTHNQVAAATRGIQHEVGVRDASCCLMC